MDGNRPDQRHAQSTEPARADGVLEVSFYQATGRPLWHAANIYVPTLLIAGAFDTWSFSEDREGLVRDLVHAPAKKKRAHPERHAFRAIQEAALRLLRGNPQVHQGIAVLST